MGTNKLDRLHQQREVLAARIRREEARERERTRKIDTRRKILAGAIALEHAGHDAAFKADLDALLARFLRRDDDRALFGLAPLPAEAVPTVADDTGDRRAA